MADNRPLFLSILAFMICLSWTSCSEFISQDISKSTVSVLSPTDSFFTSSSSVTFWWEENTQIEKYQIQIAQPDFASPITLFDSLLLESSLIRTIVPGKNTWRVRGRNEGSETSWTERILFVDNFAPDKATALNLNGDTISFGAVDSLHWFSQDQPLDGVRYPVADSVYLSLVNDSLTYLAVGYISFGNLQKYPAVDGTGSALAPGKYFWYILTKDKAGNRKVSDTFKFVVQ